MPKIAFITRGDPQWGLGHLHRVSWMLTDLAGSGCAGLELCAFCLESQQARDFNWPAEGAVLFGQSVLAAVLASGADVAVFDWLDSSPADVQALADAGIRVALLDDYGPAQAQAHLVVNALLSPLQAMDYIVAQTRILCGAPYVQFPPDVVRLRGESSAAARYMESQLVSPLARRMGGGVESPVHAVLVSFGGQAVAEAVEVALGALALASYRGRVIVIPAPPASCRPTRPEPGAPGGLDIEWLPAGPEFHELLVAADLAVLAGGLSLYEASFLGIPAVCIALNAHQFATGLKLEAAGACRVGGKQNDITPEQLAPKLGTLLHSSELRGRMSAKGLALFDGRGLQRTTAAILGLLEQ